MAKGLSAADMLGRGRKGATRVDQPADNGSTSELVDYSTSSASEPAVERLTYEKMAVSLTPEQRSWLKSTPRELGIEGISSSDLVRLALSLLRDEVDNGLDLPTRLVEQAHDEAARLTGRRNRGLPRRVS